MGGLLGPKEDEELKKRQEKQIDRQETESNRLRKRASAALRALQAGNSAFTFAGPAGLRSELGAGGVRNG